MIPQEEYRGRYEILRVVNRGGMGEIALGRVRGAKGFEKLVILKRLRADAEREDHVQMFDVEQELMSKIEHPNIVKVFDQPVIEGVPFLAMEYVRGRNLDQIIRRAKESGQALSLQFALSVLVEVLRGLAFVHRLKDAEGKALGVVHQDITPSNIMVSFFGEVKITDFGISYVTSRDGGLRRGVLKGKPRYVAPEVLAGKRVNNRADLYGVGVVLYELLTGNALFARASIKDTLAAVARNELPDMHAEFPQLADSALAIFHKALAKDPADRYRTAEEMAADGVAELAKVGGPISAARLGYLVRQYFREDPDVPEIDPAFEQALAAEAQPVLPSTFRAPDLSQTLTELDKLLGTRSSTDLFTLPNDLNTELANIADMEPFMALTPIPEFVWEPGGEEALLERAQGVLGAPTPLPSFVEPAPLSAERPPREALAAAALPSFDLAPRPREEARALAHALESPDLPMTPPVEVARPAEEESPTPKPAVPRPQDGLRPVSGPRPQSSSEPPFIPEPRAPSPAQRAARNGAEAAAQPYPARNGAEAGKAIPVTRPRVEDRSSFQFWLGLAIGAGIGLAAGAYLFSILAVR